MRKKNYLGIIDLPINIEDTNLFPKTNLHPILFDEVSILKPEQESQSSMKQAVDSTAKENQVKNGS